MNQPGTRQIIAIFGAARSRRVVLALGVIWSLSLIDLSLTVALMSTTGMVESNPIARAIVQVNDCTHPLIAWKLLCTMLCTVILTSLRQRLTAEAAAWICVAILALTTISWVRYLGCDEIAHLSRAPSSSAIAPVEWVVVDR